MDPCNEETGTLSLPPLLVPIVQAKHVPNPLFGMLLDQLASDLSHYASLHKVLFKPGRRGNPAYALPLRLSSKDHLPFPVRDLPKPLRNLHRPEGPKANSNSRIPHMSARFTWAVLYFSLTRTL